MSLHSIRAMIFASAFLSTLAALSGFIGAVQGASEGSPPSLLVMLVLFGLFGTVKAGIEVAAAFKLRRIPNVPLSALPIAPTLSKVAFAWLILFWIALVVAVVHVLYGAVMLAVVVFGIILVVIVAIVTIGFGASDAYHKYENALSIVTWPLEMEKKAFDIVTGNLLGAVLVALGIGIALFGPTLIALFFLIRGDALFQQLPNQQGRPSV